MTPRRWIVAKYVPDLRRREPINLGVILLGRSGVRMRFLGERGPKLDARTLRHLVADTDMCRGWVRYWRHVASSITSDADVARLTLNQDVSSYYLEQSGSELVSGETSDDDLLAELYATLVEQRDPVEQVASVATEDSAEALVMAVLGDRVERNQLVQLHDVPVFVEYKFSSSVTHYMKRVSLAGKNQTAWKDAQAAAFAFEHLRLADPASRTIALVKYRGLAKAAPQIEILGSAAIIDVDASDAEQRLAHAVGV